MSAWRRLLDPWRVSVADLRDLADSRAADAGAHLDTIYGWRYEQLVARARGVTAFGASLLTAILVGLVVPNDGELIWPLAVVALAVSLLVVAIGAFLHAQAGRVQRTYLVAHTVLADLRQGGGS